MFKKFQSFIVFSILFSLICCTKVRAFPKQEKEDGFAAKIKAEITNLAGRGAQIAVKLRDNTKTKGYVSEIRDGSFVVTNYKLNASTEILYSQVKQVKQVKRYSFPTKAVIGYGLVAFIIIGNIVMVLAKEKD